VRRVFAVLSIICALAFSLPARPAGRQGISSSDRYTPVKKNYRKKQEPAREAGGSVYRVKKGDTLYRIGRQFSVKPEEILSANNLTSDDTIFTGMKLKIPVKRNVVSRDVSPAYRDESVTGHSRGGSFIWPVSNIVSVKRDGDANVRSIGIIITSGNGNVRASSSGVVEKVGRMRGFGNFVVIRHAGGMVSVYSGLDSINVREGDAVTGGRSIGFLGEEKGDLHFMVHRSGKPEDPLRILPSERN
ncbi:MAG TPA: peptidoglycan DD-metalloendopeptidase family protein, partial [Spirochaetota bacterium]|nr:peptidoglycan DD-metalloendopeptidase family protein [Spirochaetota bacterium]